MIDIPRTPKPRPAPTQQERDESAIARVARSSRLTRDLLVRLRGRRRHGELDSEAWDDVTAMLDHFTPGYAPRVTQAPAAPATSKPASAATLPELIEAVERLSSGLETGRIYDRDIVTLRPALNRLGDAWIRRTAR